MAILPHASLSGTSGDSVPNRANPRAHENKIQNQVGNVQNISLFLQDLFHFSRIRDLQQILSGKTRRVVKLALVLGMLMPLSAWATSCGNQYGMGSDKPHNVTLNGTCLVDDSNVNITSWYNNTPGKLQLCFQTNSPADTLAQLDYNSNQSYSGPTTERQIYNSSLVTNHCIVLDNIMAGRTQMLIPASCSNGGSGGKHGLRCGRFDPQWSVAGYEQDNGNHGFVFTAPSANSSHALSWQFFVTDSSLHIYRGSPGNLDLAGVQVDGPLPSYIYATSLKVDGQSCPASRTGSYCGSTHVKVILDNNGGEVPDNGSNGYNVLIASSGSHAGQFYFGGTTAQVGSYVFNIPGSMLRIMTDGSTGLGSHTLTATFQATNASGANMGSPVNLSYSFTVLAPASFTRTAPTSFPTIPSLSTWNSYISSWGQQFYNGFKTQNQTQGFYDNDNYSAALSAATDAVWNYGGDRIALDFGDYLNGNQTWYLNAQRIYDQRLAWGLNAPRSSNGIWQEWNLFPHAFAQWWWRFADAEAKKALAYTLTPLVDNHAMATQPLIWAYKYVPLDTIRTMPYSLGALSDQWLVTGEPVTNDGVDEGQARVDLLLQALDEVINCNPVEGSGNSFPICPGTPTFDLGLVTEELIHWYSAQSYEGVTPDGRIPVVIGQLMDWFYSNEFNQTGSDYTSPYSLFLIPGEPAGNNQLNMLTAPAFTWLWTMSGDNCRLPTSGVSCLTAGDKMAQHALDGNYFYGAKQFNQVYKLFPTYYNWRTGNWTGLETDLLPSTNPAQAILPDKMEPWNGGSWPAGAPTCTPTSSSVTCTWYTFKPTVSSTLKVVAQSGAGCPAWNKTGSGPAGSFVGGTDDQYKNAASISGLAPGTTYCVAFGATDSHGNSALSDLNPVTQAPYTFTTQR